MRGFHLKLAAIVASGFAIRVLYALLVAKRAPFLGDARAFQSLAQHLVHGNGFSLRNPGRAALRPTAEKPPLYPLVLAAGQAVRGGYVSQHIVDCACGAGTIAVVGVLGKRVARETVGLLAAALAAVYPVLIVTDGSLRSESLYGLLIAVTLVAGYQASDQPTNGRVAALGVVIGLSALVRAEALLLVPLLGIPLVRRARGTRLRVGALLCAGCIVVVVPWTVRNLLVFDRPVVISTNDASLVEGANCHASYSGATTGEWVPQCVHRLAGNQATEAAHQRERGLDYAGAHFARLPAVAAVRVLRTWGIYRPRLQWQEEAFYEGRLIGRDHDWMVENEEVPHSPRNDHDDAPSAHQRSHA